jgi:short-subunit dehydrogenase
MARRRLENLRAIVTGASSGIGWHLAIQLAQQRANVVAVARRAERLDDLKTAAKSLPGKIVTVVGDVTDAKVRHGLLETCQREFGGLDLLVNNAGTTAMGPFVEAGPARLRQIFEVNFFALAEMTREAIPILKQGLAPMIVNISSVLGHRAAPLKAEYCASKFAVHGFSDAIRAELVEYGIDLLLVSPSTTDSEFFEHAIEDSTDRDWKKSGAMPPELVAKKTIRAIQKGRHEIILTAGGRFIVWLDRLIPSFANRMVAKFGQ